MTKPSGRAFLSFASFLCCCVALLLPLDAFPQQTLGGITGTVTDSSGGVLADATVTVVSDSTQLTRTQKTTSVGSYDFVNLPIGSYTLTFSHDGFETQRIPSIVLQADRTATLNATLKVGQVGTTVTVEATPLLNAVDTTNGYILEKTSDRIRSLCPPAALPALPFSLPVSTRNSPAAPASTPASAIYPSGPTASATPATPFSSMASTPAISSTAKAPAK